MRETQLNDKEGRGRAHPASYEVQIAGTDLDFFVTSFADPVPTGHQIGRASGQGNPDELIVLQQLTNRSLEELRLDETTDLRTDGPKRFIVAKSDRTFRFIVEGQKFEWPASDPSALIVKKLLGKEHGYVLVQELEDRPDQVIEDNERLHLEGHGTERFKLRKAVPLVTVKYNHKPQKLEQRTYSTEELLATFKVPSGYVLERIADDGEFIELKPGDGVLIEKCMEFVSHVPCGGAS